MYKNEEETNKFYNDFVANINKSMSEVDNGLSLNRKITNNIDEAIEANKDLQNDTNFMKNISIFKSGQEDLNECKNGLEILGKKSVGFANNVCEGFDNVICNPKLGHFPDNKAKQDFSWCTEEI